MRARLALVILLALAGPAQALVAPLAPALARVGLGVTTAPLVLVQEDDDEFVVRSASARPLLVEFSLAEAAAARRVDVRVDGELFLRMRQGALVVAGGPIALAPGESLDVEVRVRGSQEARVALRIEARPWPGGPLAAFGWVAGEDRDERD